MKNYRKMMRVGTTLGKEKGTKFKRDAVRRSHYMIMTVDDDVSYSGMIFDGISRSNECPKHHSDMYRWVTPPSQKFPSSTFLCAHGRISFYEFGARRRSDNIKRRSAGVE